MELDAEVPAKHPADDLRLAAAQQAIVDKDAGELLPDGLVEQGGGHAGINTPAQSENDPFRPNLVFDFLHRLVNEMPHGPMLAAAADAVDEIGNDFPPARSVDDLGMKLESEKSPVPVLDGGELRVVGGGHRLEAVRRRDQLVPVGIPDLQGIGEVGEDGGEGVRDQECALALFAFASAGDLAAEHARHQLHAVTDAQDRDAEVKNRAIGQRRLWRTDAGRAAGEDQAAGFEGRDLRRRHVEGDDGGINLAFAHAPRDDLRILRAEIQNENLLRH